MVGFSKKSIYFKEVAEKAHDDLLYSIIYILFLVTETLLAHQAAAVGCGCCWAEWEKEWEFIFPSLCR